MKNISSVLWTLVLLCFVVPAKADQESALSWLAQQQASNGAISTLSDVANDDQSTFEAANSFVMHDQSGYQTEISLAGDYLSSYALSNSSTETLSNRIILKSAVSAPIEAEVQALLSRRNATGGWGDFDGFASTPHSTSFALLALNEIGLPADSSSLQYLLNTQNGDGSWSMSLFDAASVEVTSYASNALWAYRKSFPSQIALTQAASYLFNKRSSTTQLWSTTEQSALALLSLVRQTTDRASLNDSVTQLVQQQLPNGSFENDVYLTALVAQLQQLVAEPAEDAMSISGRVLDRDTSLPLGSVSVRASGAEASQVTSQPDGRFSIVIDQPGTYSLDFSFAGYGTVSLQTSLEEGENKALNDIVLTKLEIDPETGEPIETGNVRGTVLAALDGNPLSGVEITVNGDSRYAALSDSEGNYFINNVPSGAISIMATLNGYQTAIATSQLEASQSLIFSPSLVATVPDTVVISGLVIDVAGSPVASATIEVSSGSSVLTAQTDSSGQYRVEDIPVGLLSYSISAAGYQTVSGSVEFPSGGTLTLSPTLVLIGEPPLENVGGIQGHVVNSVNGQAIEGAAVSIRYIDSGSVINLVSQAGGTFDVGNLPTGDVLIELVADNFTTRTIQSNILGDAIINLGQINLIPSSSEVIANIQGVVVDSITGLPLEGVQLFFDGDGYLTDQVGVFSFTSDSVENFQLSFNKEGYQRTTLGVSVKLGQDLNLGSIRMRPVDVIRLAPDLRPTGIDRARLINDLDTGNVSGEVDVEFRNAGTSPVNSTVRITVFNDINKNDSLDIGSDIVLGTTTYLDGIDTGSSATASVQIAGELAFRDAPIHVKVDSDNVVLELNENNNTLNTADTCEFDSRCTLNEVPLGNPVVKWAWSQATEEPTFNQVMMTPLVAQTNDDNGDGTIDSADIPDIIFSAHSASSGTGGSAPGFIRIISGDSGAELSLFDSVGPVVEAYASLALGDIDHDGVIEVVAAGFQGGVYAFEHDGSLKWYQPDAGKNYYGGASIADLDGDGKVEILINGGVLSATGEIIWQGNIFQGQFGTGTSIPYRGSVPYAADIDVDGVQEVVYGGTVYKFDGTILWQNSASPDGLSAVGNFDDDENPEIVVVRNKRITLVDHDGSTLWNIPTVDGGEGGAPTIADFDGDGSVEIGVAGSVRYAVYEKDGSVLWQAQTFDTSSRVTGSSVFDFNNDGKNEVVYADERNIHVFDGSTGQSIFKLPHSSATTYEYPVIADIDNDGHAEIVVAQNSVYRPGNTPQNGIRVFEEENDSWVGTRAIWNQHAYSIGNVNDDGSIPTNPEKSWLTHNTFRLNAFPQCFDDGITIQEEIYLNHTNISVSLGSGMTAEPFENRSTAGSLESIIDAASADAPEDHNQQTHVWIRNVPLELRFDFGREYSVTTLHFWNYFTEEFDVDNIDFAFYDGNNQFVGALNNVSPALGGSNGNPIYAENIRLSFPNNVRYVEAVLTGTNGEVDFNNMGFTALVNKLDPVVKWEWPPVGENPGFSQITTTPMVAQVNDDNADGVIDTNDVPDVIFTAYQNNLEDGRLRVISGVDGTQLWASQTRVTSTFPPAVGDIDNDGLIEIIIGGRSGEGLFAFEHDGTLKWQNAQVRDTRAGAPAIADVDNDGEAEIVYGARLIDAQGNIEWSMRNGIDDPLPLVVNLDRTGDMEIVSGDRAFDSQGNLVWDLDLPKAPNNQLWGIGIWSAVGDLDEDDFPEIAMVVFTGTDKPGSLYIVEHDGQVKMGPIAIPTFGGGPPTLGDFDADGMLEIGVAASEAYTVFESDGTIKWSAPTQDISSARTGSSVFDFEDDGRAEVMYADERHFRIYDGETGAELFKLENTSRTVSEYPVVVDIDNDGHSEIIIVANNDPVYGINKGIRVLEDANDNWVNTRRIWNQHTYHINNISENGAIPSNESESWLTHNTYRLNTFVDRRASAKTDFTVSQLKVIDNGAGQAFTLSVRVGNGGANPSPVGTSVAFYKVSQNGTRELISRASRLPSISEGEYVDLTIGDVNGLTISDTIVAIVDETFKVDECDETNNSMTVKVGAIAGLVEVTTNAATYGADQQVQLTNTVSNVSSFSNTFRVSTRIEDSAGALVIEFSEQSTSLLQSEASEVLNEDWNTGATLAGEYVAITTLHGADDEVLATDVAQFEIIADSDGLPDARVKPTTDRSIYHITDSVEIASLVQNLASNAIQSGVTLNVSVTGPSNQVVYQNTTPLGDLASRYSNQTIDLLTLDNAEVGEFVVTATLLTTDNQVLASGSAEFSTVVELNVAISGAVTVSDVQITPGESLSCLDRVSNMSSLKINEIQLRQLLVAIDAEEVLAQEISEVSLAAGSSTDLTRQVETSALVQGNYACAVQTMIGGDWVTLDSDFFQVLEQPIQIGLEAELGSKGRVLVLLDNSLQCTDEPFGPQAAPDLATQQAYLENILTESGWSYTITLSEADFVREMRTGGYVNYLLLAELERLSHFAQKELREAVYRGEGLVEAGKRLQPHEELDTAFGIQHRGQTHRASGINLLESDMGSPQTVLFTHQDKNLRVAARSAQTVAEYLSGRLQKSSDHTGRHRHGSRRFNRYDPKWCPQEPHVDPAVTLNHFGFGKAIFMGFDILSEASSFGGTENPFSDLLLNALELVNPDPAISAAGTDTQVLLSVFNLGSATTGTLVLPIPTNVAVADHGEGELDENSGTVRWAFELEQGAVFITPIWLQMPTEQTTLTASVYTGEITDLILRAETSFSLTPDEFSDLNEVIDSVSGVHSLTKVRQSLKHAKNYLNKQKFESALRSLLLASNHVAQIQKHYSNDELAALRANISWIIRDTQMQIVLESSEHRCKMRGSWGGHQYPQQPKSCGHHQWHNYGHKFKQADDHRTEVNVSVSN